MISNICLSCGDDLDWPSGDGCANMTTHKNDNKPWENLVTDELVKRLRDWPRQGATKSTNLLGDAADRIEALTTHIDSYRVANMQLLVEITQAFERIEALTAERDRLRGALEKLECKCSSNCDWLHDDVCPSWIARAALKGESRD